jgi:hypothetical protein
VTPCPREGVDLLGNVRSYRVVERRFKSAVATAGFELRKLTDGQTAGLIGDQMRAAILACLILIADLTHGNHGAYWEAGFAGD